MPNTASPPNPQLLRPHRSRRAARGVARTEILEYRNLARIHIFRNRLPFMHRDGWDGPRASSSIAFAWFVWDRDYHGLPTIDRISWEREL